MKIQLIIAALMILSLATVVLADSDSTTISFVIDRTPPTSGFVRLEWNDIYVGFRPLFTADDSISPVKDVVFWLVTPDEECGDGPTDVDEELRGVADRIEQNTGYWLPLNFKSAGVYDICYSGRDVVGNISPKRAHWLKDIIFMAVDEVNCENTARKFRYIVARNCFVDSSNKLECESISEPKTIDISTGTSAQGGGLAIGDIDGGGPEVIFFVIDNPEGENHFRYLLYSNCTGPDVVSDCTLLTSSPVQIDDSHLGYDNEGGGATLFTESGIKYLLLMGVDPGEKEKDPNYLTHTRYKINGIRDGQLDLSCTKHGKWKNVWGTNSQGGGVATLPFDYFTPRLYMTVDAPENDNHFWFGVSPGPSSGYDTVRSGIGLGYYSAGGGLDVWDLNGNGKPDILAVVLDDPTDKDKDDAESGFGGGTGGGANNKFRYIVYIDCSYSSSDGVTCSKSPSTVYQIDTSIGDCSAGAGVAVFDPNRVL